MYFILPTLYSLLCVMAPCIIYMVFFCKKNTLKHNILILIFMLYCWKVFELTGTGGLTDIFYRPDTGRKFSLVQGSVNLVPFSGLNISFILNIVMCVPLGFLLPIIWKSYRKIVPVFLAGALFSLIIEVSQIITTRATDIDDLIANIFGAVIGFILWAVLSRVVSLKDKSSTVDYLEPYIYILIGFTGKFLLYFPFWFAFEVLS
ncbi:VanZ family protein [Enterococcus faecium]|uniref:VanZ family protein n=1 Tax=Enterococcus faecium TaxID=1352 RepID=UPI000DF37BB2|nr:VanZ family protein [Enterococcus faecium]RCT77528.1 VanZ family protein [Enterococcus faecium]